MTAIGLFVAVPAVMGYNWLLRRNKDIIEKLRYFAADLHSYLVRRCTLSTAVRRLQRVRPRARRFASKAHTVSEPASDVLLCMAMSVQAPRKPKSGRCRRSTRRRSSTSCWVLLIVFMITIPVITHTVPGRAAEGPANEATKTSRENINLSVTRNGRSFWNLGLIPDNNTLAGDA
jgi:hypothetical protein